MAASAAHLVAWLVGATDLLAAAIDNNAAWCATVCAAHGVRSRHGPTTWHTEPGPPRYYPDVVTLTRDATAAKVAQLVAARPAAGVKDSFAQLALSPHGFRALFDARWLAWLPDDARAPAVRWSEIRTPDALTAWQAAWAAAPEDRGTFPPGLLHGDTRFLALRDGDTIVAGCAVYRSARVVGISNAFGPIDRAAAWAAALAELGDREAVVGYEAPDDAAALVEAGARDLGPLRVWLRP